MRIGIKFFFFFVLISFWAACSSNSSEVDNPPAGSTTAVDLATFIRWAGSAWDGIVPLMDSSKDINLPTCSVSGTIDLDDPDTQIQDCVDVNNGVGYTATGTYNITVSGSLTTHGWNQDIMVDENNDGNFASNEPSFTTTGSISFDTDNDSTVFDFSAVFSGETLRFTGSVTDNGDGMTDTTFWVLSDGEAYQSGQFANADLSQLSDENVDSACSDNSSSTCATRECSTDFECQLFADDSQTDEFETGNTVCTDGCCALSENVSDCPGSTACSDNFTCQLFADNSSTDEFETNNVACDVSSGCCITTN